MNIGHPTSNVECVAHVSGTVVTLPSGFLFASEKSNEIKKEIGIPEGYDHVCAVALGYRDGEDPAAPPRNKNVINRIS